MATQTPPRSKVVGFLDEAGNLTITEEALNLAFLNGIPFFEPQLQQSLQTQLFEP